MKHPLLTLLFSASLTAFSQVADTTHLLRYFDSGKWVNPILRVEILDLAPERPDTARCTLLVSFTGRKVRRIPFTMPGFVVRREFKDNVYLDDKGRIIKAPLKVFSYVKD